MSDVNDVMDEHGDEIREITTEEVMEKLEHLKRTLHPEEQLNIIDQCAIVAVSLAWGSPFEEDREGLASFLDISPNQVYKMKTIHFQALPEMKEYLRKTDYRAHTAYNLGSMSAESQREFLDAETTLDRGVYITSSEEEFVYKEPSDTSDRTIIGEDEE